MPKAVVSPDGRCDAQGLRGASMPLLKKPSPPRHKVNGSQEGCRPTDESKHPHPHHVHWAPRAACCPPGLPSALDAPSASAAPCKAQCPPLSNQAWPPSKTFTPLTDI